MVGHPTGNLNPEGSDVYEARSGALEDTKLATGQFPRFLEIRYHKSAEAYWNTSAMQGVIYYLLCYRMRDQPYVVCLKGYAGATGIARSSYFGHSGSTFSEK